MSEPFIAEIRLVGFNFAPRGWAFCDGQLLPVSQNTALFSLIGTTYGGDGRTTTALPNLQGRMAMHPGRGPGLTARRLGQRGGDTTVTLSESQMPSHTHNLRATNQRNFGVSGPANNVFGRVRSGGTPYAAPGNMTAMASQSVTTVGGSQAHENRQPFLGMNFVIALQGQYPSRS